MTKPIDRRTPPVPGIPKDVTFPDYFESVLPNGLKVIVYQRSAFPMVTINIVARSGSYFDGNTPGLASIMSEMLTRGTRTGSAMKIVDEIEYLGGSIGANAGWDSSMAGTTILSKNASTAMEVLADIVQNPTFPQEELERVREQRLSMLLQRKSSPGALAATRFQSAVFGQHPYGKPAEGTESSVNTLTTADLAEFHRRTFSPNNAFIIAVGDLSPERMMEMSAERFGDWAPVDPLVASASTASGPEAVVVNVVDRPSAVQSSILVGHVGIDRRNEDYVATTLMNTLFGGYFGSRLNLNLRENKGFTYGAHSRFDGRVHPGPFSAGADVRNDVTAAAIEEILREIHRMRNDVVGREELDGVKSYVTGNFPMQIETPNQVAQRIVSIELYGLGKTYYNTYNSRVLAVTAEDIHRVAQRYLHPDRIAIVAAGKATVLREALARFGTVDVYSADGDIIPNSSSSIQQSHP